MSIMFLTILIIIGFCLGSFINALVWRLHQQELIKKNNKAKKLVPQELSVLKGRSMCPNCRHRLGVIDLIPVISWLALRGNCRYCHKPISRQYPLIEIITPLLFIASYIWWPVNIQGYQVAVFALWLALLVGLIALSVYDLKWYILPSRIIYPLYIIALVLAGIEILFSNNIPSALINEIVAIILGGGVFYILFQVSNGKWIGGGDVRLGFLLGTIAGTPGKSILLLFLGSLIGSLTAIPLLISKKLKRNSVIPFGPFLIVAVIVIELFGHIILTWYQNTFFPTGF